MSRLRTLTAAAGASAVVVALTAGAGAASAAPHPAGVPLPGSAVPFTTQTTSTGDLAGSQVLTVQLWLKPDLAAAERFAAEVSTPGSRSFRHYLSPAGYAARFGATSGQAAAVAGWLRSQGFTGVTVDAGRDYVRASGAVAKIDTAFHTTVKLYQATRRVNAGPYPLHANDGPVTLPASLAGDVLGVTGLDNAAPVLPLQRPGTSLHLPAAMSASGPCSQYYGQHTVSGLPARFGTTSFPTEGCGYTASQLRKAYGATWAATGKGQRIALVELGLAPQMFLTLRDYAKTMKMPAPSSSRYAELNQQPKSCQGDAFFVEEQLDVEASYDMAPGARQLVVGGDGCNNGDFGLQGLFNADTAVINGNGHHPLATVSSNSWEGGPEGQAPLATGIEHAYLTKAADVGVGMYFSAGDSSGVETPSSDPLAIGVGGTSLGIGQDSNRLFETGWSNAALVPVNGSWEVVGENGAAGGGPSTLWKQPSYQRGVVPSSLSRSPGNRGGRIRSVDDISADADPFTGMLIGLLTTGTSFATTDIGGTSLASPLVAGMVTAAQQGQRDSFGLLNPVFYKLAGTKALHDALPLTQDSPTRWRAEACATKDLCGPAFLNQFDDQSTSLLGYTGQVTRRGYDNMTGVGTPNGWAFIAALRRLG